MKASALNTEKSLLEQIQAEVRAQVIGEPETSPEDARDQINAVKRIAKIKLAKESLIEFTELTMPDPDDPDDPGRSRYQAFKHHRALAAALEQAEKGLFPRLIVTFPPRHGKSELVTRRFIPWVIGRDPYRQVISATYNEEFARDFGAEVRNTINEPSYKQIFPGMGLRKGGTAKDRLQTTAGGLLVFKGRGGALTGRGADFLLIDDLIKDAEEADSPTIREKCWEWFTKVAMSRLMSVGSAVVIVMTRWHEDDVVGRLTDPSNPCYDKEEAARWKIIDLPAIAGDDDPLGRQPGEVLWPEKYPLEFLEAQRRLNPRGFSALYQQRPTPEDGDFFKREWIVRTDMTKVDKSRMRIYAASDHAVGTSKDKHDRTVLLIIGVDENDDIYLLDCFMGRETPDFIIERMIDFIEIYNPITWWAESGAISKSLGPFLRKRMLEREVYCSVEEIPAYANKEQRAQSIRGRMAMKKVIFPQSKLWTAEAVDELMKFPAGRHDDFVDTLAYVGLKLGQQFGPSRRRDGKNTGPRVGSLAWVKWDAAFREKERAITADTGGF